MKNKKKFFSILLIIISIVLIIFLLFKAYSYVTFSKISKAVDELLDKNNSGEDLYYKVTETDYNNEERTYISEYARKNNTYIMRTADENDVQETLHVFISNSNNDLWNGYMAYDNELYYNLYIEDYIEDIMTGVICNFPYYLSKDGFEDKKSFLEELIFSPYIYSTEYSGENCYVVNQPQIKGYVSKNTLLPIAMELYSSNYDELLVKYLYEYNGELLNKDVEDINPEDYSKVEYVDNTNTNYNLDNNDVIPEKPISGTNLNAGESLIENVELSPQEELNSLKLTGNSFGIKTINLKTLESYNKFRKKYSNLRELTEEDFKYYTATLIFKEDYKLNYLEHLENLHNWDMNYVFSSEKTEKSELVLLVSPISKNGIVDAIENNEYIKIDPQTAYNILENNLDKISKELKLDYLDVSFAGFSDKLEKLSNETFAKMSFINNPVEGNEPICWAESYKVFREEVVEDSPIELIAYIDAMTGDFIGVVIE